MGQRGASAAFMPNKFVFPGGRVDEADAHIRLSPDLPTRELSRLSAHANDTPPRALAAGAIRELWEETGLRLGTSGGPVPQNWPGFAEKDLCPDASTLRFIFRAVTPPGRPRRFDARFFLAPATAIHGDLTDFSAADDELSHLSWLSIEETRDLDLPFITRIVLSELAARLDAPETDRPVPFFDQSQPQSRFLQIGAPAGA